MASTQSSKERALMDAYWRAANQIYLYDNPLLKQSLTKDHIKPRPLGHWGTTPSLNFIYVHLNRLVKKHDLDMIYITGPGHGGPVWSRTPISSGPTARSIRTFLPMKRHEAPVQTILLLWRNPQPRCTGDARFNSAGGELGYALSHAYGAAFDNSNLIVA